MDLDEETRIHFRYHDAVEALVGHHHWRYEVHRYGDLGELVKYLSGKGMDEFAWRPLRSLESWREEALSEAR